MSIIVCYVLASFALAGCGSPPPQPSHLKELNTNTSVLTIKQYILETRNNLSYALKQTVLILEQLLVFIDQLIRLLIVAAVAVKQQLFINSIEFTLRPRDVARTTDLLCVGYISKRTSQELHRCPISI